MSCSRAATCAKIAAPALESADPRPCSHPSVISPDTGGYVQAASSPNGAVSRQASSTYRGPGRPRSPRTSARPSPRPARPAGGTPGRARPARPPCVPAPVVRVDPAAAGNPHQVPGQFHHRQRSSRAACSVSMTAPSVRVMPRPAVPDDIAARAISASVSTRRAAAYACRP